MRKIIITTLCLILGFLTFNYTGAEQKETRKPNLIIIVLGTLRADHLGCYGYSKNTSPNLDRFSKECFLYKNAYSHSNWTLPSHCSILTSRYPSVHGVMERETRLDPAEVTLPEILKNYDYQTAAFTGGLDMRREHGLDQGFDLYSDDAEGRILGTSDNIFPKAIDWLQSADTNNPFFLYIHTYDTHLPYTPPAPYDTMFAPRDYQGRFKGRKLTYEYLKIVSGPLPKEDIDYVVSQYDGEIACQDKQLGLFLDKIKESGLDRNTIIVVTADHGESLYEHDSWDRFGSEDLYHSTLRVPLVIYGYNKIGSSASYIGLVDIMPTILSLLKIPANKDAQGLSRHTSKDPLADIFLVDAVAGSLPVIAESSMARQALIKGNTKLIASRASYELYDLDKDPREQNNLASGNPDKVYEMVQELMGILKRIRNERRNPPRITLSPQMIDELRKSGYWDKDDDK